MSAALGFGFIAAGKLDMIVRGGGEEVERGAVLQARRASWAVPWSRAVDNEGQDQSRRKT